MQKSQYLWQLKNLLKEYKTYILSASLVVLAVCIGWVYQPDSNLKTTNKVGADPCVCPEKGRTHGFAPTDFNGIPMYFIENHGQTDERVRYYIQGQDHSVFFTDDGMVLNIVKTVGAGPRACPDSGQPQGIAPTDTVETVSYEEKSPSESPLDKGGYRGIALKFSFLGAKTNPTGVNEKKGKVNYFIGNDPEKWKTAIPTYSEIAYKNLYEGIDLVYKGEQGRLKYDLIVNPGADISKIRFACEGAEGLSIADTGDLIIKTAIGELRDTKPYAYQIINGEKKEVGAGFQIPPNPPLTKGGRGDFAYGFYVEDYDKNLPLIIDPSLVYSTFLGGNGYDWCHDIAVDAAGNVYVTGQTNSANFPTTLGAFDTSPNGTYDVFVTKIDPAGSSLIYSTYLGGSYSSIDTRFLQYYNTAIAVDASGNAYTTGQTSYSNFPTTPGAYDRTSGGAFITKLDATGSSLEYSTFLNGVSCFDIAVDAYGNAYVTGGAASYLPTTPGAYDTSHNGGFWDVFVTKLDATGSSLIYSTFIGGSGSDYPGDSSSQTEWGRGIALDALGNAYITGFTASSNFPTTLGAFDRIYNRYRDVFVTKLDATGSSLIYSTFLGGNSEDYGEGIAVDALGNAYVAGLTPSTSFPTTAGANRSHSGGYWDIFVTKLNTTGSLTYSTFIGGNGRDVAYGIAVDATGNVYVTGITQSSNFPTTAGAYDTSLGGSQDAFMIKLQPLGHSIEDIVYSTFLGGSLEDMGYEIAFATYFGASVEDRVYVTGYTSGGGYPTTPGAYDTTFNGGTYDAFVSVFSFSVPQTCVDAHDINLSGYCASLAGSPEDNPVTPLDALIILGLAVGAITPDMLSPALTPAAAAIIGDGDGDGILEPVDALIALGVAVGSVPPQAPNPRCVPSSDIGTCP